MHQRLAGVTALELGGQGPEVGYVFDPHRLALPCWTLALKEKERATLVTLDRHLDLVPPPQPPPPTRELRAVDEYARWTLDVRNWDHILAAMELGLVGDAVVVARMRPREAFEGPVYTDARGEAHQVVVVPTVDRLSHEYGRAKASPESQAVQRILSGDAPVLLDVDLDCFTSPSDADPTSVLPWDEALIRDFLLPRGSESFWEQVLARCRCLTVAREPPHIGGLVRTGHLFEDMAQVLFSELLETDVP